MAALLDTSILARLANANDTLHNTASDAALKLHRKGVALHITAQNLVEFRNVATRAIHLNGLGLTAGEATAKAAGFESQFSLLPETPDIYPTWKVIVDSLNVIGKQVHDARLVAVCHVHSISHLMTFNTTHFARLATAAPGVVVVDLATV